MVRVRWHWIISGSLSGNVAPISSSGFSKADVMCPSGNMFGSRRSCGCSDKEYHQNAGFQCPHLQFRCMEPKKMGPVCIFNSPTSTKQQLSHEGWLLSPECSPSLVSDHSIGKSPRCFTEACFQFPDAVAARFSRNFSRNVVFRGSLLACYS